VIIQEIGNAAVEIIKNGQLLHTFEVISPVFQIEYVDTSDITGDRYGPESCIVQNDRYYLNEYSDNALDDPELLTTDGVDVYLIRVVSENKK